MTSHDITAVFHTTYTLLRDTGRRPWEICNLRLSCIESDGDDYSLVWNNRKGRRNRWRLLPITATTAHTILAWREHRLTLSPLARSPARPLEAGITCFLRSATTAATNT